VHAGFLQKSDLAGQNERQDLAGKSSVQNELGSMVADMISGKGPGIASLAKTTGKKIGFVHSFEAAGWKTSQ
jgi:hypothetical protein